MKIYTLNDRIPPAVYGLGIFDGVHLGHAKLIERVKSMAQSQGTNAGLFIFDPPPALYFVPNIENYQLTTIDEKIEALSRFGLDHLVIVPFDAAMKNLSPLAFFEEILIGRLSSKGLVCGSNYHFGNDKHGDSEYLALLSANHDIPCEVISLLKDSEVVSSSTIRTLIHADNLKMAASLLGRNYSISGKVVTGKDMGKKIGFPTANIETGRYKLFPTPGIYKVNVRYRGENYKGVMHYGTTPTIDDSGKKQIEVHILGFSRDIYGENIDIGIVEKIREIKKFNSIGELKEAIDRDIKASWG